MRLSVPPYPQLLDVRKLPLVIASCITILDQASKWLVVRAWPEGHQTVVIPGFFHLVHFRNPGAAWGVLGRHTEILAIVSFLALLAILFGFRRMVEGVGIRALALAVIMGGVAGNLVDRVARREVVDFLFFFWREFRYPAFNVADMAITCGVALFILSSFLHGHEQDETAANAG